VTDSTTSVALHYASWNGDSTISDYTWASNVLDISASTWDNQNYDPNSLASGTDVVIQQAGEYMINFSMSNGQSASSSANYIRVNGVTVSNAIADAGTHVRGSVTATAIVSLLVGDVVTFTRSSNQDQAWGNITVQQLPTTA